MIRHIRRARPLLLGKHGNDVQTSGVGSVLGRQTGATLRVRWEWRGTFIALHVWNHQRDSNDAATPLTNHFMSWNVQLLVNTNSQWANRMAAAKTTSTEVQSSVVNVVNMIAGLQEFQDLLVIYWDFHHITTISGVDKVDGSGMRIPPVSCSCVEEKALVMRGVRGQNGQSGILYLWKMSSLGFRLTAKRKPNIVCYLSMNEWIQSDTKHGMILHGYGPIYCMCYFLQLNHMSGFSFIIIWTVFIT